MKIIWVESQGRKMCNDRRKGGEWAGNDHRVMEIRGQRRIEGMVGMEGDSGIGMGR